VAFNILDWEPMKDPTIQSLLQSIDYPGTAEIKSDGRTFKQADASFGLAGTLPSLVCEVL
jgi:hypothetical protein